MLRPYEEYGSRVSRPTGPQILLQVYKGWVLRAHFFRHADNKIVTTELAHSLCPAG